MQLVSAEQKKRKEKKIQKKLQCSISQDIWNSRREERRSRGDLEERRGKEMTFCRNYLNLVSMLTFL